MATTPARAPFVGAMPRHEPGEGAAPTSREDAAAALAVLHDAAPGWAATSIDARLDLIDELIGRTLDAAAGWARAVAEAGGVSPASPAAGEAWMSGPLATLRHLSLLRRTLRDLRDHGQPRPPGVDVGPNGQTRVRVLPADTIDRVLLPGFEAEVRLLPGIAPDEALARSGGPYRPDAPHGTDTSPSVDAAGADAAGVALVLGAGDARGVGVIDTLHQVFALGRVVLFKPSPRAGHLVVHLSAAMAPLLRDGLLRIVEGGAVLGDWLARHELVDAVHLIGTDRTRAALLGSPTGGSARPRPRSRARAGGGAGAALGKPLTAALGSVTPVVVVPGPWSDRDVRLQGDNLASMIVHDAGASCTSARVIVQHRGWARRRALLDAVRASLRRAEPRQPPDEGARARWEAFVEHYRSAERFGPYDGDLVPFTLVPELEPDGADELAFAADPGCAITAEVALDAPRSVPEFVAQAVAFCNDRLFGDLAATLVVHPRSLRDPLIAEAVEAATDDLRYGTVVINHFAGVAQALASTPWGAYAGGDAASGESGAGFVRDAYLLDGVEKAVVRGPFAPTLTPLWWHTNRRAHVLAPRLARYVAGGGAHRVPGLLAGAVRA